MMSKITERINMNIKKITSIALNETKNPECLTTKQILTNHTLFKNKQGKIIISRIDDFREKDAAYVYFPLKDKTKRKAKDFYYYLVIVIRKNERYLLKVSASYIESDVRVYLSIKSDYLTPEEITSRLQLTPTRIGRKGEAWGKGKYPKNTWCFEPQKDVPETLERKMYHLLDKLTPFETNIVNLPNNVDKCINIYYSGYSEWMSQVYFDYLILHKISSLKVGLWFDLYACGPELGEGDD